MFPVIPMKKDCVSLENSLQKTKKQPQWYHSLNLKVASTETK